MGVERVAEVVLCDVGRPTAEDRHLSKAVPVLADGQDPVRTGRIVERHDDGLVRPVFGGDAAHNLEAGTADRHLGADIALPDELDDRVRFGYRARREFTALSIAELPICWPQSASTGLSMNR
jgi:hypothetical protein